MLFKALVFPDGFES